MTAVQFKYLPLTKSQTAIWTAQTLYPDKSLCNLSGYIEIKTDIEIDRFKVAARKVCSENEAFRLHFMDTQDGPRQYIDQDSQCALSFYQFMSVAEKIFSSPNKLALSVFAITGAVILWKIWEFIYHRLIVHGSKLFKSGLDPLTISD